MVQVFFKIFVACLSVVCSYNTDACLNTTTQKRQGTQSFIKIHLSLYLKGLWVWEGAWDRTELQHIDPHSMAISVSFPLSRAAQPEARGPTLLGAGFLYRILSPTGLISKLTDCLSSPSYIIVQSPTQYLPLTDHRDVSLPLYLEWHIWLSSNGDNSHAVHRSLSSGASVWLYRGILPCPILSAKPAYAKGTCNFRVFGMACLPGSKVNIQHVVL